MRKELTAAEIKSVKREGIYRAGPTLYLRIAPGGSKSWVQRLTIARKRHDIGLGGYPQVGLAHARKLALQNREIAWAGGDPLALKRKSKLPTFKQAAEKTFEANRGRWRSEKTARNWAGECTNTAHAVMELSLAHKVGSAVEQAYARSDLLAKRRRLMEQRAAYITGAEAEVVQLHG